MRSLFTRRRTSSSKLLAEELPELSEFPEVLFGAVFFDIDEVFQSFLTAKALTVVPALTVILLPLLILLLYVVGFLPLVV